MELVNSPGLVNNEGNVPREGILMGDHADFMADKSEQRFIRLQFIADTFLREKNWDAFSKLVLCLESSFFKRSGPSSSKASLGRIYLTRAIEKGDVAIVEELLHKGVDVREFHKGQTAIHQAAGRGDLSMLELFWERGLDMNCVDERGTVVISSAIKSNNKNVNDVAHWLLSHGANSCKRSSDGKSPIHVAATLTAPLVDMFVAVGCDVDEQEDVNGDTPLHVACTRCNSETVACLIKNGADLNKRNFNQETPLVKLLKHVGHSSDFHSQSRVRLAQKLVDLGGHLGVLHTGNFITCQRERKCLALYRQIKLSRRCIRSMKQLARVSIRETVCNLRRNVESLPLPQNLQRYIMLHDPPTRQFLNNMECSK